MAAKSLPPADVLHKLLEYDPEAGALKWRARTPPMFKAGNTSAESNCMAWNSRYAGATAGVLSASGYVAVMIDYQNFQAHRLIWKMAYGSDPNEIDHIDGVRTNNRLHNLRSVSRLVNNQNRKVRKDSASGVIGVYWVARKNRWTAEIRVNGRKRSLGYFVDLADATAARKKAEEEAGFHPNHGRN